MKRIKRVIKIICGWSLVVLGFIGLFLPVLQGILMILGGIAILETEQEIKWLRKIKKYFKDKLKKK